MFVSIVIPTCDRPDLLVRLLKSIKIQTHSEFEIIIVNDASSDLDAYEKVISDSKIEQPIKHLVQPERLGAPACRNRGILEAQYEYIALVDDDDEWLPEKLFKQVDLALLSPRAGLIYTWADGVGLSGDIIFEYRSRHRGDLRRQILDGCFIPSPSVMVERSAIVKSGLFDERLPSCQDWDMWTRILHNGYDAEVVEEVLCYHHSHNGPTLGKSVRARKGYALYHRKHLGKLVRYLKARSVLRYLLGRFGSY